MEKNNEGGLLVELTEEEKLSGVEKLLRYIGNLADKYYLLVRIHKYPLVPFMPQYKVIIYKRKNNKWEVLFKEEGMELKLVLLEVKTKLDKFKDDNKDYIIRKAGGGEFI